MDLSAILQSLGNRGRSGTLVVRRSGEGERHVHFQKGLIKLVAAPCQDADLLGAALPKSRLLAPEEVEAAREEARKSGALLGNLLLKRVRARGVEGWAALEEWITQEGADLCTWTGAHCEFLPVRAGAESPHPQISRLGGGVSPARMVLGALSRADEWERIRKVFDPGKEVFKAVGAGPARAAEGRKDAEVAALVNGRRDVSEICELSPLQALGTCKALLRLVEGGHVRARDTAGLTAMAQNAAARNDWSRALRLYRLILERGAGLPELLIEAARACEMLGDSKSARVHLGEYVNWHMERSLFDDAIRACRRLIKLDPVDPRPRMQLYRALSAAGETRRARLAGKELVLVYEKQGAFDRAREVLYLLRAEFPEDADIQQLDVWIRLMSTDLSEALAQYEELSREYLEDGQIKEAMKFAITAWGKTLSARAARLQNEVDLLRTEVEEVSDQLETSEGRVHEMERDLADMHAALKSIELAYLAGRGRVPHSIDSLHPFTRPIQRD